MIKESLAEKFIQRFSVRGTVVLFLVIGAFAIAIVDKESRSSFADIAKFGIGGYLGQLLPGSQNKSNKDF